MPRAYGDPVRDFVAFTPEAHGRARTDLRVRAAMPDDVPALARVLASRGGDAGELEERAARIVARVPVLVVGELGPGDEASEISAGSGDVVGYSGAHRHWVVPDGEEEWVVAGLTVLPEARRSGVGIALLRAVVAEVARRDPGAPLFSVANVHNSASIALHERVGFVEVARGPAFAGATFEGGVGVLLRGHADREEGAE